MNFQTLPLSAFLVLGAALGVAYLSALAWNVRLYCAGFSALAWSLHLLRFVSTVAIFFALAQSGPVPLLSGFAGFQLTRVVGCAVRLPPRAGL
jgi:F1F0 ATPase subunit 2